MNSPYGLWSSPIYRKSFSFPPLAFLDLQVDGASVYWTESRLEEKGRNALMCYSANTGIEEKFPFMSVQTRVHEYGGGSFCVEEGMIVVFDAKTKALYLETRERELILLIQDPTKRFADFSISPDQKKIIAVCEDHAEEKFVRNYLVVIDIATKVWTIVKQGADFYASPRFSPDGQKIAFLFWNFPSMPWDECSLTVASLLPKDEACDLIIT